MIDAPLSPTARGLHHMTEGSTESRAASTEFVAGCGCGVQESLEEGRVVLDVDPANKDRNLKRLRRIEGQVRGLQKMIEGDRYCADIMTQISSVQEALRAVGRELLRNHLKHCASAAIRGSDDEAAAMYDELVGLFYRAAR